MYDLNFINQFFISNKKLNPNPQQNQNRHRQHQKHQLHLQKLYNKTHQIHKNIIDLKILKHQIAIELEIVSYKTAVSDKQHQGIINTVNILPKK